jgi:hypothetical protein
MNNETINTKLEQIRLIIESEYNGDVTRVATDFLKQNTHLVDREDGILYPEKVEGWIVIELPSEDSDERNPKPVVHSYAEKEDARDHANSLYPGCTEAWLNVVCKQEAIIHWRITAGSRKKTERVEATEDNLIEQGVNQIESRISSHLNTLTSNRKPGILPYQRYGSLDEIQTKWQEPVTDYQVKYAKYVQDNHAFDESGQHRMITKKEHQASQNHEGSLVRPKLPDIKLRINPNPDFVEALHSFLIPSDIPSISEVTARSHYKIARFFNEDPKFRCSLTSSKNTTRAYTNSNFQETVSKMTKFGFTMQAILDSDTNRCVGSLNLDQMVHLLSKKSRPKNLDIEELKSFGILGPIPPVLDGKASVSQAEALFSNGCKAILFEYFEEQDGGKDRASAATLEQGLHIMTPHDLVAFLTLGED